MLSVQGQPDTALHTFSRRQRIHSALAKCQNHSAAAGHREERWLPDGRLLRLLLLLLLLLVLLLGWQRQDDRPHGSVGRRKNGRRSAGAQNNHRRRAAGKGTLPPLPCPTHRPLKLVWEVSEASWSSWCGRVPGVCLPRSGPSLDERWPGWAGQERREDTTERSENEGRRSENFLPQLNLLCDRASFV